MRPQNPTSRQHGFTLVELLVAVTLLSIVMAAVYSAFSSTLQLWKTGDTNVETYQDARTSMSIFTRELQNVVAGSEFMFSGTKDSVTFYAAIEPMDVEAGEQTRLAQITYRLKQNPARRVWTLVREEALVEGPLPVVTKDSGAVDSDALKLGKEHLYEMAAEVKDFSLAYLWLLPAEADSTTPGGEKPSPKLIEKDESPEGDGLPQGVRVSLTCKDDKSDSGETTFTETIAFSGPTTTLTADETPSKEPLK